MPRETLRVPLRLESLSVLASDGTVDEALEPRLDEGDLVRLYQTMLTSRRFDERCLQLQRQGRLGTYAPSIGQEAASLGAAYALGPRDWLVPSFRELAGLVWRGWPLHLVLLCWGGHEAGNLVPEGLHDLPFSIPIASQCQYAMGLAWAGKLRGHRQVCMVFCGDGGTSEGDFHESLNFAGVYNLPLITVVQNNHWAISVPRSAQTAAQTIAQKALAYGMDGVQVDGNDLLAVIVAAREAVEKARTGGGPTLIEAVTYRLSMHTTADDPKKYRQEAEVKEWEQRDPLPRFRKYLQNKGVLDDQTQKAIDEQIGRQLEEAVKRYLSHQVEPLEFFDYMYAEKTPELRRQQAELRRYLQPEQTTTAASAEAAGGDGRRTAPWPS